MTYHSLLRSTPLPARRSLVFGKDGVEERLEVGVDDVGPQVVGLQIQSLGFAAEGLIGSA